MIRSNYPPHSLALSALECDDTDEAIAEAAWRLVFGERRSFTPLAADFVASIARNTAAYIQCADDEGDERPIPDELASVFDWQADEDCYPELTTYERAAALAQQLGVFPARSPYMRALGREVAARIAEVV